jgi:hypothetical protein
MEYAAAGVRDVVRRSVFPTLVAATFLRLFGISESPLEISNVIKSPAHPARLVGLIAFTLEEIDWRGYLPDGYKVVIPRCLPC